MCVVVGFVTSYITMGKTLEHLKIKYMRNILKNSEYYVGENLKLLIKQVW